MSGEGTGLRGLYAVRHGLSAANAAFAEGVGAGGEPVLGGSDADVPLTGEGYRQAARLGGWLAGAGVDLVAVSPFLRARQTWEAMAGGHPGPVVADERLRDRDMGVFELMTPAGIALRAPEEAARRVRLGEWDYRPPGGESLADVALRVRDFVRDAHAAAPGRTLLVVAHDATVVCLRYVLAGFGAPLPDLAFAVPNASVSHWTADPGAARGAMRLRAFGTLPPPAA